MRRKLLFAERMLLGDGDTPFNMVFPVKIKGSFTIDRMNIALKKLQGRHPLLNAYVEYDIKGRPWFVTDGTRPNVPVKTIKRLNDDDWKAVTLQEWAKPFNTRVGPLMRLVWLQGEPVSELLLVFHHCFCDGEGAFTILSEMLLLLDDENTPIGESYPLLNIVDLIPADVLKSRRKIIKAKLFGGIANLVLKLIPVKKKALDRGGDYLIHWKLDKELSDGLVVKCKANDLTVNTALCVAVLSAFKDVRRENFHNKISCPVNIRKFVSQIPKDQIFAFGLMFVVSIKKLANFFGEAKLMQLDISKKLSRQKPYDTIMMMEEAHPSLNKFMDFLKYGKSSNDCMFSNLGRIKIPHQYKSFSIETIFSPSVIGPLGNTTTLLTSTYNGLMDFTFIGSEKYLPYQDALAIKHSLIAIISAQVQN